jgi:hypothetical protein
MKNILIRIILMIAMALSFFAYSIFVFTSPEDTLLLPLLVLVSVAGVVISILLTYKATNWVSFFFTALPMYIFSLFSFGYSILGAYPYFEYSFFTLLFIYFIRLVKIGWKSNDI